MQSKQINKSVIFLESTFKESTDKKGKKEYYMEAFILPFNKISRNGVRYQKESIEKTHDGLVGKPVMFNHILNTMDAISRGEWIETWLTEEGMWGKAKIYNTKYNESILEYLREASNPAVSLQITGKATSKKEKIDGEERYIREAEISEWLECSIIGGVQGFKDAGVRSFEVAICEAFDGQEIETDLFEELNTIREKFTKE